MENNPYDILGISPASSKSEITKSVALAMKRKQYPVDVIAKAQRSLMKPEDRIIADYLRPVLPIAKRFKYSDLSTLDASIPKLDFLSQFDGLEAAIAQAKQKESLERESVAIPLKELLPEGSTAYKQEDFSKIILYVAQILNVHKSQIKINQNLVILSYEI